MVGAIMLGRALERTAVRKREEAEQLRRELAQQCEDAERQNEALKLQLQKLEDGDDGEDGGGAAELDELRARLQRLADEKDTNQRMYEKRRAERMRTDLVARQLEAKLETLDMEVHRKRAEIEKQEDVNLQEERRIQELAGQREQLTSVLGGLKRELMVLNDLYKQSLREEKTMEVNLEYEAMACKKINDEIEKMKAKIADQEATSAARERAYREEAVRLQTLKEERVALTATYRREMQREERRLSAGGSSGGALLPSAITITDASQSSSTGLHHDSNDPFRVLVEPTASQQVAASASANAGGASTGAVYAGGGNPFGLGFGYSEASSSEAIGLPRAVGYAYTAASATNPFAPVATASPMTRSVAAAAGDSDNPFGDPFAASDVQPLPLTTGCGGDDPFGAAGLAFGDHHRAAASPTAAVFDDPFSTSAAGAGNPFG